MAVSGLPFILDRGCGLDVHKDTVVATIKGSDFETETRTFLTFTEDLYELVAWLQSYSITEVAMESTGVYWRPVYSILEDYCNIILVNARHIKNVPGQKTDKKDSEWICKLLLSGLLKSSFIPEQQTRELRELYRHRRKLVSSRTAEKNRLQNILESANIKLRSVVSDVFGVSAMQMIHAIIQGQTDPEILANFAKGSLRNKRAQLVKALKGNITKHHIFMLNLILESINNINLQIAQLEAQMEQYRSSMQKDVELLETIPGISRQLALSVLGEIGNDMSYFPSHQNLSSWAGLCPGNNESAGKKYSTRITQGNKYLKASLVEASWVAIRSKANPIFAVKNYHISNRRGKKKATIAIAHKLLIAIYHVLRDKEPYQLHTQDKKILEHRRIKKIERFQLEIEKLKNIQIQ